MTGYFLAHLVEQLVHNQLVIGSIPIETTIPPSLFSYVTFMPSSEDLSYFALLKPLSGFESQWFRKELSSKG